MIRKLKEWWSISITKHTKWFLFLIIILINAGFIFLASLWLTHLCRTRELGIIEGIYATLTMIFDAGCIEFLVGSVEEADWGLAWSCIIVIFGGTLIFTGALIGFITNLISGIIDNVDAGKRKIHASDHTVILNWNTRASEIINDLLYKSGRQKVVVLVNAGKEWIVKEIEERLTDTVRRENRELREKTERLRREGKMTAFCAFTYRLKHRFRNNLTVIVREGDVFSTKQLEDISLKHAKSVVILGSDAANATCPFEGKDRLAMLKKGNTLTVKTLMQVADMTAAEDSNDKQTIVVEITDEWTKDLVQRISLAKEDSSRGNHVGKNNIVAVDVNKTLGQILSQFSLMPELNGVYSDLFSNKGAAFYCTPATGSEESIDEYFESHFHAIPLAVMKVREKLIRYFVADDKDDGTRTSLRQCEPITVEMDPDYGNGTKNVIILGHNSKMNELMEGFESFRREWSSGANDLRITVISDEASLEKSDYFRGYSFVTTYASDIYDKERISDKIREIVAGNSTDTSVLILSDDSVPKEDIDSNALTNLVYLQDIIRKKVEEGEATGRPFDTGSIDVIVEIIDPKHYDVVRSYSQNNVVISNRYISKMITQISDSFEIYSFYQDILSYDESQSSGGQTNYSSYEVYIKEVSRFFRKIPGKCTAAQLIRAVYRQSTDPSVFSDQLNPTMVLGYVRPHDEKPMRLFTGDQSSIEVELQPGDKLIVYSLH